MGLRKLPKYNVLIVDRVFSKINHEIKIFNKLKIRHRTNHLDILIKNPNYIERGDGIEKLFYVVACANLYRFRGNDLCLKNVLYTFARTKIKSLRKAKFSKNRYFTYKQVKYKYLNQKIVGEQDFEIGQELKRRNAGNNVTYYNDDVTIKNYVDKKLPIDIYEITGRINFTYKIGDDKMQYDISHTADTLYVTGHDYIAFYVDGRAEFSTTMAGKGDELKITIKTENAKIHIIRAKTKKEIISLKNKEINYQTDFAEDIEASCNTAMNSHFVTGENLREKFVETQKIIPTLFLPTLVFKIQSTDSFFEIIDRFPIYKKIAECNQNINLVFLYSSQNHEVREIINAFIDRNEAKGLIDIGVFIFFVDTMTASNSVVNLLTLMGECKPKKVVKCSALMHVNNTFPVTYKYFVRNDSTRQKKMKVNVVFPLGGLAVVKKQGNVLAVHELKSYAKPYTLKIPFACNINEMICREISLQTDATFAPHEEKEYRIIKNDGVVGRNEKKQMFIGSIEQLSVSATDSRLARLVDLPVSDGTCKNLDLIKRIVSNFDKELFFKVATEMTIDLWTFVIEKIIGIKLVRGRVQLMPCIQITGDFELNFVYNGKPYNFSVKQKNQGFTINYGEKQFKNFASVEVDVV